MKNWLKMRFWVSRYPDDGGGWFTSIRFAFVCLVVLNKYRAIDRMYANSELSTGFFLGWIPLTAKPGDLIPKILGITWQAY